MPLSPNADDIRGLMCEATATWRHNFSPDRPNSCGEKILAELARIGVNLVTLAEVDDAKVALNVEILRDSIIDYLTLTVGKQPGGWSKVLARLSNLGE